MPCRHAPIYVSPPSCSYRSVLFTSSCRLASSVSAPSADFLPRRSVHNGRDSSAMLLVPRSCRHNSHSSPPATPLLLPHHNHNHRSFPPSSITHTAHSLTPQRLASPRQILVSMPNSSSQWDFINRRLTSKINISSPRSRRVFLNKAKKLQKNREFTW